MNDAATSPNDRSHDPTGPSLRETALTLIKPLASLQLTIFLFLLSLVLVFFGTLAQIDEGIWTVVAKYFRSELVWIPAQLFVKFLITFFALNPDTHVSWSFPFPGGLIIGWAMLLNLLAAHVVRFRFTWKRAGVLIIHSGIAILLISEFITYLYAVESTMTLSVGESCDFVDESLTVELAISRPVESGVDEVVKVPQSFLRHPGRIKSAELPVDIEIVEYWKNSSLEFARGHAPDRDWHSLGNGEIVTVKNRPEEAGVEQNQRGDAPAVRVNLFKKDSDEIVGSYLLSLWYYPNSSMNSRQILLPPFRFQADGKDYTIELRNKRMYKPYTIHLLKFEHAKYEQTEIAKDFASTVEVIDPQENTDRQVRIYMNNPLRYGGDSLYQLSVLRADSGTVLQVVRNPGRFLPYLSCALIVAGLLVHFGKMLLKFLARIESRPLPLSRNDDETDDEPARRNEPIFARYIPLAVVALAAAWIVAKAIPPRAAADRIDFYDAGKIPVLHNGRLKPLDTVARTSLQALSGRSEVQNLDREVVASAVQWFLQTTDTQDLDSAKTADYEVFRIDNDLLLGLLHLKPKPQFFRYSWNELRPHFKELKAEIKKAEAKGGKKLDLFDNKILDLAKKIQLYQRIVEGEMPSIVPPIESGQEWLSLQKVDSEVPTDAEKEAAIDKARATIGKFLEQEYGDIAKVSPEVLRQANEMVPVLAQKMLFDSSVQFRGRVRASATDMTELIRKAKDNDVGGFKKALASYRENDLKLISETQMSDVEYEALLNHMDPFYLCTILYVMVIIFGCLSWLFWRNSLGLTAFWLAVLTFGLHASALLARMYIQNRPPVTNLYSSAIFIGLGCVLLCLIIERIYRNGISIVAGAAMGASTMMVAHFLSEGGDTMEMLVAVLDSNFWLATHVTVVTLGYMATFVAGTIAVFYVLGGIFTTAIDQRTNKIFGQMLYGVIAFATLLSFTGTVLGGIWADYSWGRFWGWDAKENGAVMVVVWNTLILHARWAGLVKLRGMALLALVGNMITVWSWFGTNQLGAGLHSYGFNTALAVGCRWYWVAMAGFILIGLLPTQYWRSFAEQPERDDARRGRASKDDKRRSIVKS